MASRKRSRPRPKRCRAAPSGCRCPPAHHVNGARLEAPFPAGLETRHVRAGLLLGRGEEVLAAEGGLHHRRRLCRRAHAQPDLPRSLHRHDRPQRGRAGRVRSEARSPTTSCSRSSGRTTIRPRGCGRAATSARSTGPASTTTTRRSRQAAERTRDAYQQQLTARRATAAITTEILPAPEFYYAEDYHQQYLVQESRTATAGSAAPASPARWGSRSDNSHHPTPRLPRTADDPGSWLSGIRGRPGRFS